MLFDRQNYPQIRAAFQSRSNIQFTVKKEDTVFANENAPTSWTAYPPAHLIPEDFAKVWQHAGTNAYAALTRLELYAALNGGKILYQANGQDLVDLDVQWPPPTSD